MWIHLRNINIPNSILLGVQSSLVFALLGLSFVEKQTSTPSALTRNDPFNTQWFAHHKNTARLISDETAVQVIAIIISAGTAGVSTITFVKRFQPTSCGWESSLLATTLFWTLYWIVFTYIRKSGGPPSVPGRVLRLADTAAALEDLRGLWNDESRVTMWRLARGRSLPDLPEHVVRALQRSKDPDSLSMPKKLRLFHRSLLTEMPAFWTIPVGLVIPLVVVTMIVGADKSISAAELRHFIIITVSGAMLVTVFFGFSMLSLYQAIIERLSQREFVPSYFLAWTMHVMSAFFFFIWLLKVGILHYDNSSFINVAALLFCAFSFPALTKWGYLLARPLKNPNKAPLKQIIDHIVKTLEAEQAELITEIRKDLPHQPTRQRIQMR
ncbi:hypothetical protein [Schaalia vaccimaxillae]|uniref:hypothetical protein n=1 Tax=Schaalia vaccimaxillae TaxID=183916 RepID=UPI0003B4D9F5|nr:hypothetical protein [Schaalia vaccimaxillae]